MLPTLAEWQAAVRGSEGKAESACPESVQHDSIEPCMVTSDLGLIMATGPLATEEFTRTVACWPGNRHDDPGLFPLVVSTESGHLNLFAPRRPRPISGTNKVPTAWFRCVRDRVTP